MKLNDPSGLFIVSKISPRVERLNVSVGPIRIPKKLDRPQIVTRINSNEIHLNEFASWGDPLASGFSRVLAENLSVLLNTEKVAIFPWMQAVQTDYQVTVDVTDFIGTGVLTAGTQTIANTNIAAGDVILLTRTGVGASTALGELTYTISAGASFTVTSLGVTTATILVGDVSTYAYFIVRPS